MPSASGCDRFVRIARVRPTTGVTTPRTTPRRKPAVLSPCGGPPAGDLTPGWLAARLAGPAGTTLAWYAGTMAIRNRPSRRARSATAGSWLALLAATTLGDAADTLRAEVRARGLTEGAYRLVVQSYDATAGKIPGPDARPVGSLQRAVTADELQRGVHVNLLELRAGAVRPSGDTPVVVAWIEAGEPDLEFDAREARPRAGSMYGVVKRAAKQDVVQISLNRKLAT